MKNPILRNTIAKITTLQQAATIGNVKIEDLVNLLRKEVGQDLISITIDTKYNTNQPNWFNITKIIKEIDIREFLEAGEQPVNQVLSDLNNLKINEIYKVIAPFLPAPLIDKASSLNFDHWILKQSDNLFWIYFTKKEK